mmetsp:Transcript_67012/g.195944  ORF Transcript_67012/g.195944 Transcript_67012/m.195944 type:complete len:262 (+) Transcript_67012:2204-2989(+)
MQRCWCRQSWGRCCTASWFSSLGNAWGARSGWSAPSAHGFASRLEPRARKRSARRRQTGMQPPIAALPRACSPRPRGLRSKTVARRRRSLTRTTMTTRVCSTTPMRSASAPTTESQQTTRWSKAMCTRRGTRKLRDAARGEFHWPSQQQWSSPSKCLRRSLRCTLCTFSGGPEHLLQGSSSSAYYSRSSFSLQRVCFSPAALGPCGRSLPPCPYGFTPIAWQGTCSHLHLSSSVWHRSFWSMCSMTPFLRSTICTSCSYIV